MNDRRRVRSRLLAFAATVTTLVALACTVPVSAQTYQVIHDFNVEDGLYPFSGLTADGRGNFYGTTYGGGPGNDDGTVYKLSRRGTSWTVTSLYGFTYSGSGGYSPIGRIVFGPNGSLYGTTSRGGSGCGGIGCGVVFRLNPPPTTCPSVSCPWIEHVLHRFADNGQDGNYPYSEVVFDRNGNLYGTTTQGGTNGLGPNGLGTVYEITPSGVESVIYSFTGEIDGEVPEAPVILDAAGNLYGTTFIGMNGDGGGSAYELSPTQSGFQIHVLHNFYNEGLPVGGLLFDSLGNLYGTTSSGGSQFGGTVWELAGGTIFSTLWNIAGTPGNGPSSSLVMDASGNLYGANFGDYNRDRGSIFKLSFAGGIWNYTDLHDFAGGADGSNPNGPLTIDAQGNIYGTTQNGGTGCNGNGCGVIFEIMP